MVAITQDNVVHTYHDAMLIELKFEGGKDNDPVDPGGRTNQGVIQREFSAWLRKNGQLNRDVFTMTDDERDKIYYENYGLKIRFNELPPGINVVVLDGAINSGPGQSIKWLQRALGLNADGVLGNVTMLNVMDYPDHDVLIGKIIAIREAFLRALKTFWHFGKGWISRTQQLKRIGQSWAMGSVGPPVVWEANMHKKAMIMDAKTPFSTAPADMTAAGGTVMTALTTVQQTLQPLQGSSHLVDQILIGLMVFGGLATAFGLSYAYFARTKNTELKDALGDDAVKQAVGANDNNIVPNEVLAQYADPTARGFETGNTAVGVITTSGRKAGDPPVAPDQKAA